MERDCTAIARGAQQPQAVLARNIQQVMSRTLISKN